MKNHYIGEEPEPECKGPVYCDALHCKFGHISTNGDGYNEPYGVDFDCDKFDELDAEGYADFEEDDTRPMCPMFRVHDRLDELEQAVEHMRAGIEVAGYENERLIFAVDSLTGQLAQAQADNAAMMDALSKWKCFAHFCGNPKDWRTGESLEKLYRQCIQAGEEALSSPCLGADLLKETEQLRKLASAITHYMPLLPGEKGHMDLRTYLTNAGYTPMENGIWTKGEADHV